MSTHYFETASTVGNLLAAIPAALGYVPANRLVVITTHRPNRTIEEVRMIVALDLSTSLGSIAELPERCGITIRNTAGAYLVAIGEPSRHGEARALLNAADTALRNSDIRVHARIITESLTDANRWQNIDTGETGENVDYRDSVHVAEAVYTGARVVGSREEIVAEFAESDEAPEVPEGVTFNLGEIADEIARAVEGGSASADLATRAGIAITSCVHLRDSMLYRGTANPRGTAALWTKLASQLRGLSRIEALIVAGMMYYTAGDGPRSNVALETADNLAAALGVPLPRLGLLLTAAFQSGITPEDMKRLLATGADLQARK
ncbi:DUF4192 domain-containing protein [[Mycobacterium] nativiensis]|uniref:DUF4192 domain-containing protein n=1 Tax=[Mycobacterium] nativiensis TaxID=2855503 RepID=A0ABU5XVD5_9MYCO|nr:DUF4192 domain-containing protein [Mycolicibacter sp. MYC340]MEB3031762.1 DUF4192 domain-containing protein [Mycolicibacter sp. MYC340]